MATRTTISSLLALLAVGVLAVAPAALHADSLITDGTLAIAMGTTALQTELSVADSPVNDEAHPIVLSEATLALAPVTDREEAFVPAGKREMLASLAVPELAPTPTRTVLPGYPVFAQQSKLQGTVYARVLVDTSGKVAQVGGIKGQAVFHDAVRQAAAKWQFAPARQGDMAVQTWVTVPFSFQL